MNWPARIYIKAFAQEGMDQVRDSEFIPIFQGWIRDSALEGTWIDVADYGHVHQGPGVLLAGHDGHLMTDREDGRLGLLYQSRRSQGLAPDLKRLLSACALLESAPSLSGRLKFSMDKLLVGVNDRLVIAAGLDEDAWGRAILEALREVGVTASLPATPGNDPHTGGKASRLSVTVRFDTAITMQSLAHFPA